MLFALFRAHSQCSPDITPPEITCPADITTSCPHIIGNTFDFQTSIAPTTSDNCGSIVSQTYTLSGATNRSSPSSGINDASSENFLAGTTTVTYTVKDAANNSSTCSFTVTIDDFTPPTVICPTNLTFNNTLGNCYAEVTQNELGFPSSSDNCNGISTEVSGITLIDQPDPLPDYYEFPIGTTQVNWIVTDRAGNVTTCVQEVTVIDAEPPIVNCPIDITIDATLGECEAFVNVPLATSSDNCSVISLTNDYTSNGADASAIYPIGTTVVTYTATDSANITAECSINITVVNSQLPVITLIGDNPMTLEACDSYLEDGASALDSCLGDLTADIIIDYGTFNPNVVGSYNITYNVTNSAGVSAAPLIRTVDVVDTTAPTLTLIGPDILNIGNCSTYTELGALAIDPCFGDISTNINISYSSPIDTNILSTYTVTYSVIDDNGNSGDSITRTVTVIDSSPPDIVLLGDNPQIIEACNPYIELGATAIDPCSNADFSSSGFLTIDASAVNTSVVGLYPVTYNAIDDASPTPNSALEVIRMVEVVDTTAPLITLIGDNPQIIEACTAYTELGATVSDCSANTLDIDTSGIDLDTEGLYTISYTACDVYGNCSNISRDIEVVNSNPTVNAGSDITNTICNETTINLSADPIIGSNATGLWTVSSGQISGFSFSDPSSPTASFIGEVGETYVLTWTITTPCSAISDSLTAIFINCSTLDFDGVDDNITFKDNFNLNANFTIELWVKSETQNNEIQTIVSKRDVTNLVNGFDIRLVNNYISFHWNDGESLAAPYQIITNQWHHIAVTNAGGTYSLYIDGVIMNSTSGTIPISNLADCIIGAMDQPTVAPFKPEHYFDGGMDELRIWDTALSPMQIRTMMNQEIEDNAGSVKGTIAPLDMLGLPWTSLIGYYRMNQSSDIISGNLTANNNITINGLLRNMTTLQAETAPIPYRSVADGIWTNSNTWLYGAVQAIPNSLSIDGTTPIEWNIVTTSHNLSSGDKNITVLGLKVSNNTLSIENNDPLDGQSLRVTDYLYIDGTLDLVGESQLLQNQNSIVDYSGSGALRRTQQGTTNLYNYNYWGSPVGANGSTFTLQNIIFDGTQAVQWTTQHNANASTTPITLSNRWLYVYENFPVNSYADWQAINESSPIATGLGFLMKGSGNTGLEQNYTFVGQPNNGTITTPISANYSALVGNPYPSAIDAHEFINDNSSSIQGTLYFWEHYTSNATHILEDYEGGYAAYNLSGGNQAVSPPEISGLGTSLKIPERYIPVGQGFFVEALATDGQVTFENDQRVFVKEAFTGDTNNGSVFMRTASNEETIEPTDNLIQRIRIQFKTPEGAVRPLLLAFTPNNEATDGFDYGYDAINTESFPNDMSWMITNEKYTIQGVGNFEATKQYPLGLFLTTSGAVEISLEALENFETAIEVYVYDALLNTSFNINDENFEITLDNNTYTDRFFITFLPTNPLAVAVKNDRNPLIYYLTELNQIYIKIPNGIALKQVSLFNIIGQKVKTWKPTDIDIIDNDIRIPVNDIAEGIYIVKLETTSSNTVSKKIIVTYAD